MKVVRCFVRANGTTTIVCPACKEPKTISVLAYRDKQHTLKVRCSCKEVFPIQLDFRHHYRKKTSLPASYKPLSKPDAESTNVVITNISLSGLGFVTSSSHYLEKGDKLSIEFQLNDKQKTRLTKQVEVLNVREDYVGCCFFGNEPFEKALGFFLQR